MFFIPVGMAGLGLVEQGLGPGGLVLLLVVLGVQIAQLLVTDVPREDRLGPSLSNHALDGALLVARDLAQVDRSGVERFREFNRLGLLCHLDGSLAAGGLDLRVHDRADVAHPGAVILVLHLGDEDSAFLVKK